MLYLRSFSGSKASSPPLGLMDIGSPASHELVDQGALSVRRSQKPPNALYVLPLAVSAADDHRYISARDVETFVEDPGRDERAQFTALETTQGLAALLAANVARDGHDQILTGDGVGGLVVSGEDEHA